MQPVTPVGLEVMYLQVTEVVVAETVGVIVTTQLPTDAFPVTTIAPVVPVRVIVPWGTVGAVVPSPKPTTDCSSVSVSQDATKPPWVCRHSDIATFIESVAMMLVAHLDLVV